MKTRKRIPATLLAIATAFSLVGYAPAYAAEHIHDETCGYSEGSPCTHTIHDETCGYAEAANLPCKHELGQHDETCGYAAAMPCTDQASPAELGTLTASGVDVEALISGAACAVSSEVANTEQAVKTWLQEFWLPEIPGLQDALQSNYQIGIADLKVLPDNLSSSHFKEAQDGTSGTPDGEDGYYLFVIAMVRGGGIEILSQKTCEITAKAYTPPSLVKEAPVITASGGTPDPTTGVITAVKESAVTLTASLSSNVAEHSLQWQKKSPGDADFTDVADATGNELQITLVGDFVDLTQYRCAAVYADETFPSAPLTIQAGEKYMVSIVADGGSLLKADRISVKLTASIKDTATGQPYTGPAGYAWTLTGTDSRYFRMDATNQANMTVTVKDRTKGNHDVNVGLTVTVGDLEIPASNIVITRKEADKSGLKRNVDEAFRLLDATVAATDGSNVEVGKYWIPMGIENDLNSMANEAKSIQDKWNASESEVATAERYLEDAIAIFQIHRQPGTKSTSNNNNSSDATGNRNDSDEDSSSKENKDTTTIKGKPSKDFTAIKVKNNKITVTTGEPSFVSAKGIAKSTIKPDVSKLQKAIKNATPENPYKMSIDIPSENAAKQLKQSKVDMIQYEIQLSKKVLDNKNKKTVNLEQITLNKKVLEAAKETGKDIKIAVKDEHGSESYAITVYGKNMKDKNLSGTSMNFAADITTDENKTVIELKQDGDMPVGKIKVDVHATDSLLQKVDSSAESSTATGQETMEENEAVREAIGNLEEGGEVAGETNREEARNAQKKLLDDLIEKANVEKEETQKEGAETGGATNPEEQDVLHVYKATDMEGFYQDLGPAKVESETNTISFIADQGGRYEVMPAHKDIKVKIEAPDVGDRIEVKLNLHEGEVNPVRDKPIE